MVLAVVVVAALYVGYRVWWVWPRAAGPAAGSVAPDFALPDADGNSVTLEALVAEGPAVVAFYRGHW